MSESKYTEYSIEFDILKGISILFVAYIHFIFHIFEPDSLRFWVNLVNYLTSLAVPFFLFLGGLFFKRKFLTSDGQLSAFSLTAALRTLLIRIIVPYYIALIVLFLYLFFTSDNTMQVLPGLFFVDIHQHGLYFLIIYIYAYLICSCLIVLFRYFFKINLIVFLIPVLSFSFLIIFNHYIFVPESKNVVYSKLPLIAFFCAGFWIDYFVSKVLSSFRAKLLLLLLFLIFVIIVYILKKSYPNIIIFSDTPPTLFYLVFCFMSFLIFYYLCSRRRVVDLFKVCNFHKFGENSLFIYLIHPYFIYLFFAVNKENNCFLSTEWDLALVICLFIISYSILWLSLFAFHIMPQNLQNLFLRRTSR